MNWLERIAQEGQDYRDRVAVQARKLGLISEDSDEEIEDTEESEG